MLNEAQIGDIWLLFIEYIDRKQLDNVAEKYVDLLADYGVTDRIFQNVIGTIDNQLDKAIEYYLEEENEDEDDEDELNF